MNFIRLLFACCSVCLNKELIASRKTKINWYEAQQNCTLKGEVLPDSKDVTNSRSWTRMYRRISLLIQILGCYEDRYVQKVRKNAYKMRIPSAGFCQEICLSSSLPVFAIKNNECGCLNQTPLKGNVSRSLCNYTSCERNEEPYFDDCGGKETYSVFISGSKDERAAGRKINATPCVAIQCSVPPNFTFYFEQNCSLQYKPLCKMKESSISTTWMKSMQICKSTTSSYLSEEIFLNDINKTCNTFGGNRAERYWVGVAKEMYTGIDRGTVINSQDKDLFECFLCDMTPQNNKNCYFTSCEKQLNVSILCSEMKQEKTSRADMLEPSTLATEFSHHNRTTIGKTTKETITTSENDSSEAVTKIFITTTKSGTSAETRTISTATTTQSTAFNNESIDREQDTKDVLQIAFPLMIAVTIGGIMCILLYIYMRKKKHKLKMKSSQGVSNTGYSEVEVNTEVGSREVTGIINHNYFVLELQEQSLQSDTTCKKQTERPYIDTKDGIYDHLSEEREKRVPEENTYDQANKRFSISESPYNECEEVYDKLRDKKWTKEDNTEDTYNHLFAATSTNLDYDTSDRCNQYKLNGTYDQVSKIEPDEKNPEHDDKNNISERLNEIHTYFILSQQN